MTRIGIQSSLMPLPVCQNIGVRTATMADLLFIDGLQKQHTHQVGWMPTKQLEGKIARGHVLIAEEVGGRQYAVGSEDSDSLPTAYCPLPTALGYCIGTDQYFKRDDVGIIYQMNVVPEAARLPSLHGPPPDLARSGRAPFGGLPCPGPP